MKRDYRTVGFQWDAGNRAKCEEHGLSIAEIESLFQTDAVSVFPDPHLGEDRLRAVGRLASGRVVFIVYTHRYVGDEVVIRPISARYVHTAKVGRYGEI